MNKSEYQEYLASREWGLLKEAVRARSGGRCERCRLGKFEATHHLTYARVGHEKLEDLLGLCEDCHAFVAGRSNRDPLLLSATNRWRRCHSDALALCDSLRELHMHLCSEEPDKYWGTGLSRRTMNLWEALDYFLGVFPEKMLCNDDENFEGSHNNGKDPDGKA